MREPVGKDEGLAWSWFCYIRYEPDSIKCLEAFERNHRLHLSLMLTGNETVINGAFPSLISQLKMFIRTSQLEQQCQYWLYIYHKLRAYCKQVCCVEWNKKAIPCRNMYQKGLECRVNIVFRLNLSVVFHSRLFGYVLFFVVVQLLSSARLLLVTILVCQRHIYTKWTQVCTQFCNQIFNACKRWFHHSKFFTWIQWGKGLFIAVDCILYSRVQYWPSEFA